ncbi:hypothetical protein KI387_037523, partial [Taxus chinensis]
MAEIQIDREKNLIKCHKQKKRIVCAALPQYCLVIGECGIINMEKQDPHPNDAQ